MMSLFSNKPTKRGDQAESFAKQWLQAQGLTFLQQNYHGKRGEIDLIMQDADTLVFVEVKQRNNTKHGHPFEFINATKQRRLTRTAEQFCLSRFNSTCVNMRFDGIAITGEVNHHNSTVEWIQNIIML